MALVYDLIFSADFRSFDIVCGTTRTSITIGNLPVETNTNINDELVAEIAKLPLFINDRITITFDEFYNNNYNSVELYKNKWINNNNIGLTGKQLFETLKYNASKLYALIKDDNKFKPATNTYLQPLPNTGNLENGNYFPYLLAKRHMLFKITTLLYVSFTVAEKTMCENEESQELDFKNAKKQYNDLLKLLGDTTNLLLNIDVLKQDTSSSATRDYRANVANGANSSSDKNLALNYTTPFNNGRYPQEDDLNFRPPTGLPFNETRNNNLAKVKTK